MYKLRLKVFVWITVLGLQVCFAFPPLESYAHASYVFNIPVGWDVQIDDAQGLIYLTEDVNDPLSSNIFLLNSFNQNAFTAEQAIEQVILSSQLKDYVVLSQDYLDNGLLVTVQGVLGETGVHMALFSSVDFINNTILLASFTAPSGRFQDLGGANLIFVTVGGQDPASFSLTDSVGEGQATESATDLGCFDQSSVVFSADYCVYSRAIQSPLVLPEEALKGEWSYAFAVPSGDVWERGGDLSFDASGSGLAIFFHDDGSYDLIYSWSSSYNFCSNSVKAFEEGHYTLSNRTLSLQNASFKAELITCGGSPSLLQDDVSNEAIEIAFVSEDQLALVLSCENHNFMIGCNENQTRYFVMTRSYR